MAVDRELRRLLACALLPDPAEASTALAKDTNNSNSNAQPQRVLARDVFAKLETACHQTLLPLVGTSGDVHLAELLVLVAEAAVHQCDFATARRAVDWFLDDCAAKNQVRALNNFALSLLRLTVSCTMCS